MPSTPTFGSRTFLSDVQPREAPSLQQQTVGVDSKEGLGKDGSSEIEPVEPPAAALHNDGEGVREGEGEGEGVQVREGEGILQPPSSIQAQRDHADVAESESSSGNSASASEERQEGERGGREGGREMH